MLLLNSIWYKKLYEQLTMIAGIVTNAFPSAMRSLAQSQEGIFPFQDKKRLEVLYNSNSL